MGVRAHCQRVATWSCELARALGLSELERALVERAALAHHVPEILLDDQARSRLLADIFLEAPTLMRMASRSIFHPCCRAAMC